MLNLTEIIISFLVFIILIILFFIFRYPNLSFFLFKNFFKNGIIEYAIFILITFLSFLISFSFIFNYSYNTKLNLILEQELGDIDAIVYQYDLTTIEENELKVLINNFLIDLPFFQGLIPSYVNYSKLNNIQTLLIHLDPTNLLFLINDIDLFNTYKNLDFDEIIISESLANKNNLKESDIVELDFNNVKHIVKIKKIYSDNGIVGFDFPVSEFSNFTTGSILVSDKFLNKSIHSNNTYYINLIFFKYKNIDKLSDSDLFKINTNIKKVNNNLNFFEIRKFLLNNLTNNGFSFLSIPQLILLIIFPFILFISMFLFLLISRFISLDQISKFTIQTQILKNYGLKSGLLTFMYLIKFLILGCIGSFLGFFLNFIFGDFLISLLLNYFNYFYLDILSNFKLLLNLQVFLQAISFSIVFIFLLCLLIFFTRNFFSDDLCLAKFRVLKTRVKSKWDVLDFNNIFFIGLLIIFGFYIWQYDFGNNLDLRNFIIYFIFLVILLFLVYKAYKLFLINKRLFIIVFFLLIFVFSFLSFFFFSFLIKNLVGIIIIPFFLIIFSIIGLLIFFFKTFKFLNINFLILKILSEKIILIAFLSVLIAFILFGNILLFNINLFGFNLYTLEELLSSQSQVNSLIVLNSSGNLDANLIKKDIEKNINNQIDIFVEHISSVNFEFNNLSYYKNFIFVDNDNLEPKDVNCFSDDNDCFSKFLDGLGIFINYDLYTNLFSSQYIEAENIFNINLKFTNEQILNIPIIGVLKNNYRFSNADLIGSRILLDKTNLTFSNIFKIYLSKSDYESKNKIINYLKSNYAQYIIIFDNSKTVSNIMLFITKVFNLLRGYSFIIYFLLICWAFIALNEIIIIKNLWLEFAYSLTSKFRFAILITLSFIILILISFCLFLYSFYFYLNNILHIQINIDVIGILVSVLNHLSVIGLITFIIIIFLFFVNFVNDEKYFKESVYFRY